MKLKDLKTGDRLKLSKRGIVYIKGKHQGMYDRYVNLNSEITANTRCKRQSYRNKLEHEDTLCYPA